MATENQPRSKYNVGGGSTTSIQQKLLASLVGGDLYVKPFGAAVGAGTQSPDFSRAVADESRLRQVQDAVEKNPSNPFQKIAEVEADARYLANARLASIANNLEGNLAPLREDANKREQQRSTLVERINSVIKSKQEQLQKLVPLMNKHEKSPQVQPELMRQTKEVKELAAEERTVQINQDHITKKVKELQTRTLNNLPEESRSNLLSATRNTSSGDDARRLGR